MNFSCGGDAGKAKKGEAAGAPVSVVVAAVQQKTVPIYTELTARTDASDSVEIRARVKSFLEAQKYEEGTMVQRGQPLFTLDKREYEAQLMQARASLARAEADVSQARERSMVDTAEANLEVSQAQLNKADQDVKRLAPLAEQQAVPQQDYDNALAFQRGARADVAAKKANLNTAQVNQRTSLQQALAAVESAKAGLRQAELNLEYCDIRSPIRGIAGTRQVAPGNLVGSGEPTLLTTVSNVDPMRVHVSISEAEYLRYKRMQAEGKLNRGGLPLELILADGSVFPQKGRIIIADRAVDLKTGTFSIIAEFPNPTALLRPGQFGRVRLAATVVEGALLIPQKAVTEVQSAKVVYVVGPENKVQLRTVVLADRVGPDFVVSDGLKAGDRIIVEGIQKVRPGATVQPSEAPASTERGGNQGR